MRQVQNSNDISQDDLSPATAERLVAYDEAKATGYGAGLDTSTEAPLREQLASDLACVDLLHRVWPDFDPPPAPSESPPPKTLGDFRLIRELGRGGMGTVFEAEQISMGRHVALKVLPFAALVQDKSLQRFRNEVRAAAALDHPHIVSIYSVGEERGIHYYAMQLIRGQTLADMIEQMRKAEQEKNPSPRPHTRGEGAGRGVGSDEAPTIDSSVTPPPTNRVLQAHVSTAADSQQTAEYYRSAARLGIQAAEALQHAHDLGVLHRDIKPSNLMLDAEGQLYITDFGLARIEADAGMTMTGDIVGTLRYMAPEQALAKRVVVDHRADIYSLGATLYELLTLQPAFGETDRSDLLKQIAFEEPRPLRKLDRRIPAELETIVLKAMAKNPDERYQTAQCLADDLRAFLENRPIKAKPPSTWDRASKWSRRHRAIAASFMTAVALVALVATISGSLLGVAYRNEMQQRELAEAAALDAGREKQRTEQALQTEKTMRDSAEQNLYRAQMREAERSLHLGHTSRANALLHAYALPGSRLALRGWEWYYLLGRANQDFLTVGVHDGQVNDVAWEPDGKQFVSVSSNSLRFWDAAHHKLLREIRVPFAYFRAVAYGHDGKQLATAGLDGTVRVWNVETGRQTELLETPDHREAWGLDWSPDGRRIAAATHGGVAVWRLGTKNGAKMVPLDGGWSVAWSPDGENLAIGCGGELIVSNVDTGLEKLRYQAHGHDLWSIDWSADGSRLATGSFDQHAKIIDVETGKELHDFIHMSGVTKVVFSPNDLELVCATEGQEVVLWNVKSGKQIRTFRGHPDWVQSVDWSPDGTQLVSASRDRSVRTWKVQRPGEESRQPVWDHAINFARGLVAYPQGDGTLEICKWGTREVAYVAPGSDGYWNAAGDRLATQVDDTVRIFDSTTGDERLTFSTKGGKFLAGWSGDGKLLLTRETGSLSDVVTSWDANSGKSRSTFNVAADAQLSAQPGGSLVAACDGQTFMVWDADSGRRLASIDTSSPSANAAQLLVWSPDGERFATNHDDGSITLWEAQSGRMLHRLVGHATGHFIKCIAWSPDSARLASGGWDRTIKIWDVVAGREVLSIDAHISKIRSIAFSPDNKRLASSDWLENIRLWDAATGDEILVISDAELGKWRQLAWSNDGRTLFAHGHSGLTLFDASLGYEMAKDGRLNKALADRLYEEGIARAQSSRLEASNKAFGNADQLVGVSAWAYVARAERYRSLGMDAAAIADLEVAFRARLDDLVIGNQLAWLLANRRDGEVRDPQRALQIAEQLVHSWPEEGHFWATLGLARYRLGFWQDASVALDKAAELSRNRRGRVQFLLAMTEARLGNDKGARDALKWAITLYADEMENQHVESYDPAYQQDCDSFREELASLLAND